MTGRVLLLIALTSVLAPRAAAAAPVEPPMPAATETAADLFQKSVRAYREGRFQDSVDLLVRARAQRAEPVLLYDLGRAYEALGKPGLAADAYTQFLREDPKAEDRLATEGRIATLRRQAEAEELRKKAAASSSPPAPPHVEPPAPAAPAPTPTPVPWVVGGVGVAGVGVGVVFGLLSRSRSDAAASEPVQTTAQSNYDSAKHDATVSTIGFVAGGVLVATAAVWLVLRATSKSSTSGTLGTLATGRGVF